MNFKCKPFSFMLNSLKACAYLTEIKFQEIFRGKQEIIDERNNRKYFPLYTDVFMGQSVKRTINTT